MESSNEDIFTDASTESPVKKESVRFSTYTIYQSAQDLEMHPLDLTDTEDRNLVDGKSNSFDHRKKNPNSPEGPMCCSKMFNDGQRSVDFVIVWEEGKGPSDAEEKRSIFEANLAEEGLQMELETLDRLRFLKLHAPIPVLKRYAEVLRIRMPMKEIRGQDEIFGSEYTFVTEMKSLIARIFACVRLDPAIFPPDRFRLSAEYSHHKSYLFEENEEELFSGQTRTVVANFILERTKYSADASNNSSIGIDRLVNDGVYKASYPLHDGACEEIGSLRCLLMREWASVSKWAMYQPIDQVREYFGVKFALYFAWLGFYTHMLVPASIAGVLVMCYGLLTLPLDTLSSDICNKDLNITMCPLCDKTCDYWKLKDTCAYSKVTYLFDNPATVLFAVFMSFWAALFLELWKRYSASIAHRWGLTDFTAQSEPPRPQYLARLASSAILAKRAKVKTNVITGCAEPVLPFWSLRLPAIMVSFSLVILLVVVAVMAVLGVVLYRMSVLASVSLVRDKDWVTTYNLIIIPIGSASINLVFIVILNYVRLDCCLVD